MAKPATQPALAAQAGQAVIWNVLFLPARLVAEIGVQLIQLNVLSLAAFGVLTIIRAGVNLLGTWIDLGIERALPRFIPEVQRNNGRAGVRWFLARVMAVKLAVLALVGLALWLLSDTFLAYLETQVRGVAKLSDVEREQLLGQIERNGWFWIMAIVMLLALGAIYDVLMAYLISYFRQRAWNSVSLINMLAQPLLISAVVLLGWDVTGVVVAMLLTAALGVVLAVWQVLRVARTQPAVEDAPLDATGLLRRFVPYSALSYLFNLSDMAASYVFLVFFVQGLEQAALLSVAANIARQVLGYLYVPMQGVQVPLFTRARAGDGATLPGAYAAACRLLLLLLVPGGVGLIILAQPLVLAQFPRFVAAVPAIMLLTPFLFAESLLATSAKRVDGVGAVSADHRIAAAGVFEPAAGISAGAALRRARRGAGDRPGAGAGRRGSIRGGRTPPGAALPGCVLPAAAAGCRHHGRGAAAARRSAAHDGLEYRRTGLAVRRGDGPGAARRGSIRGGAADAGRPRPARPSAACRAAPAVEATGVAGAVRQR